MDVIEERNIDDVINHAHYMEISDIPSFEMAILNFKDYLEVATLVKFLRPLWVT